MGALTLTTGATLDASGAVALTTLTASGVTNGSATINPDLAFTTGVKTLSVGDGGNLSLNGAVSGATTLAKTGTGTLSINAANSVQVRVGASGATPTAGGTVVLGSAASTGSGQIQLNAGTLQAATAIVATNGVSIGGRTNGAAVLAGSNMEFQGQSVFFRGTGTSGELVLNVNNSTTFSGGFGLTTGTGGTATGVTIGGSGEVFITGASSALVDTITLTDTVKLTLNNTIGGGLNIGASNVLAGNGTVLGSLSLASGAKFVFSLTETLTVQGPSVSFGGFGVTDLIGLSSSTPNGVYTIFGGLATINTNNLLNFGAGNSYDLGAGKSAYFTEGSLQLNVVPEPSTYALLALSALGLAGHVIRRRCR